MGASGWHYRVKFVDSLPRTLTIVQQQVLEGNRFVWPWEDYDPDYLERDPVPRPSTLEQLDAAKNDDVFWEEGTHTILDIERMWAAADRDEFGLIRPLSAGELTQLFGTERPTREDLDRVYQFAYNSPFEDMLGERWTGRSLVAFDGDQPVEAVFWGFSGD